ncbi:MAG: ATP-binding protein [Acidimicrobiia bacterium]|nr:ATP-binding protein [Acidimicrobiia bacterium]
MRELYYAQFGTDTIGDVLNAASLVWGGEDHLLDVETIMEAIEEVMDNAVRHSGQDGGAFTLSRSGDKMVARVEDSGVGIHHNMAAASEELSVEFAFRPGPVGTSTGSRRRGGGLVLALDATASIPQMTLCLYTGHTSYTASNGKGYVTSGSGDFHQGVLVEMTCPISD